MSNPFSDALAALHNSSLGVDALYISPDGVAQSLRVIRSQDSGINGTTILDRDVVSLRCEDVAMPAPGAEIQLLGFVSVEGVPHVDPVFLIKQGPMLDEEGLTWTCAIQLA